MNLEQARRELAKLQGRKEQLENELTGARVQVKQHEKRMVAIDKAQALIQKVAEDTQNEMTYHLTDLGSMAFAAVFEDPYELDIQFVAARGKTEARICFLRDGKEVDPMASSGGGAVDLASFALRLSVWSLLGDRARNVIVMDEPFKFLRGKREQEAAVQLLTELSERLAVQVIAVPGLSLDFSDEAGRVFDCTKKRRVTTVTRRPS